MFISGNVTKFAVKRSDGNFDVGNLAKPKETTVQSFAPEGAQIVDRSVFEAAKGSEDALRRAVLGNPGVVSTTLDALHLKHDPLHRGESVVEEAGSRIAAWIDAGKPDVVKTTSIMPAQLENAQNSVEKMATVLSHKSFKAEFLAATPEQRQKFMQRMNALLDQLANMNGVSSVGSNLQSLADSITNVNGFLLDTGSKRALTISAENVGTATMIFGMHGNVVQLNIGTTEIE
jgi:hypothetical protein